MRRRPHSKIRYDLGGIPSQRERWLDLFRAEPLVESTLIAAAFAFAPAWLLWTGFMSAHYGGQSAFLLWLLCHVVVLRTFFAVLVTWAVVTGIPIAIVCVWLTDDPLQGTALSVAVSFLLYLFALGVTDDSTR